MATNPLEERKISYDEAKQMGYVIPLAYYDASGNYYNNENVVTAATANKTTPLPESYWQSNLNDNLSRIDWWINSRTGTIGFLNTITGYKQKAIEDIKNRAEAVKAETGRTFGRTKAIEQRIARATGGLLASSAAPSLSEQGKGGIPDLSSAGPSLGVSQQLGTKAKR